MPVGSKKIEICVGKIYKEEFQDNYKFSVTFEKMFSAVPILTISMLYSNKEVFAENVTASGFDAVITDTGIDEKSFMVQFQAINVIR